MRVKAASSEGLIAVDALRALAAFIVVVDHARTEFFVPWSLLDPTDRHLPAALFYASTRLGHQAVLIFFVLSGYLVSGPLLQRAIDGTVSFSSYFAARAARIFTPLLPACIVAFIVGTLVLHEPESPLRLLASAVALNDVLAPTTDFDPPLWSISFEVWFYILAGSFAAAILRREMILALTRCLLSVLVHPVTRRFSLVLEPWRNRLSLSRPSWVRRCFSSPALRYGWPVSRHSRPLSLAAK